jgi:hypothetical protein
MTTAVLKAGASCAEDHRRYLEAEFARLRVLLQRRVLWLRQHWSRDALAASHAEVISDAEADLLLAGGECEAERDFYARDAQARELQQSLEAAGTRIDALAEQLEASRATPPINRLARYFRLSPFERDVLLLCAAAEFGPAFARLFAYVQDDVARSYVTPHLAATLLSPEDPAAGLTSFLPGSVLRRYRLISMDDGDAAGLSLRPVRLATRVCEYLLGVDRPDERLAPLLLPAGPLTPIPELMEFSERIANLLLVGATPRWKALHLAGPQDSGQGSIAAAVCARLGLDLCLVELTRLRAASDRRELLAVMERDAILSGLVYYFDLDQAPADERVPLAHELARMGIFHVTASAESTPSEGALSVAVAPLDAQTQAAVWLHGLKGCGAAIAEEVIREVVEQFHFGPARIARSVETARQLAALRTGDSSDISDEDLWRACRAQSGRELEEMAQPIVACHDWNDLVVTDDVLHQLQEVAAQVANRARVYESWGFGRKLNRGRGVATLFSGHSGTGKTLAAEILAHHLRLDLFRIDLAAVVSKYIGETEKNVRRVFEAAERSGAILFFDEADALFARRSEVKDSHDRYANMEVNYLLQRMEDYHGLAILATNRKDLIDEAFLRRLRFIVDFPFPDSRLRGRIWRSAFPPEAPLEGIDFPALARLEIPGGSIRNIAFNAAFQAAQEGSAIGMKHVMRAARREYHKIGKLMQEAEFGSYYASACE